MDHNYAINNHVAEGYLLGDLNEQERDAYEEHYFNCAVCAEEVKAASEFFVNAKKVIHAEKEAELYREAKRHAIWGNWLNWRSIMQPLPATACMLVVVLGGFSGYQNQRTIPQLKERAAAQFIPSDAPQITLTVSRGTSDSLKVKRGQPGVLTFTIPPTAESEKFNSYQVDVVTEAGTKISSLNIPKQQTNDTLKLLLATADLEPGNYFLVVRGVTDGRIESGPKGELERLSFNLVLQ
jgi:negative regulator of sigma E activity